MSNVMWLSFDTKVKEMLLQARQWGRLSRTRVRHGKYKLVMWKECIKTVSQKQGIAEDHLIKTVGLLLEIFEQRRGNKTMSNMNMIVVIFFVIYTHELKNNGSLWRKNDEFKKNYLALTGRGKRCMGWMIKTIAMTKKII